MAHRCPAEADQCLVEVAEVHPAVADLDHQALLDAKTGLAY